MNPAGHHDVAGPGADWLGPLRDRFVAVARRRVAPIDVEDVVQEALRIVVEKRVAGPGGPAVEGRPPLAWCFQVLRHTIGNHYQRVRVRAAHHAPAEAAAGHAAADPTPLEALESADAVRLILAALDTLERESASCGRYLRRLLAGASPAEVAGAEGVEEAAFYRRVYRCRVRLRALLGERGVLA
jgi:DNA-directed RNA polymerase specialized sigma24 family protein